MSERKGWGAVTKGRRGVGIELKPSYFRQAAANLKAASDKCVKPEATLFDSETDAVEVVA